MTGRDKVQELPTRRIAISSTGTEITIRDFLSLAPEDEAVIQARLTEQLRGTCYCAAGSSGRLTGA
jgi:hypothetical protein